MSRGTYKCEKCSFNASNPSILVSHFNFVHYHYNYDHFVQNSKNSSQDSIGKKFKFEPQHLTKTVHKIKEVLDTNNNNNKCEMKIQNGWTCGLIFKSKLELKSHQISHGKTYLRLFQCGLCDIKFSTIGELKEHNEKCLDMLIGKTSEKSTKCHATSSNKPSRKRNCSPSKSDDDTSWDVKISNVENSEPSTENHATSSNTETNCSSRKRRKFDNNSTNIQPEIQTNTFKLNKSKN